jgi:hypothetical protein
MTFASICSEQIYPEKAKEILSAKLDALAKTNMVDFAKEIFTKLHGSDAPTGMFPFSKFNFSSLGDVGEIFCFLPPFGSVSCFWAWPFDFRRAAENC